MARAGGAEPPLAAAPVRIDQGAQVVEPVGRDQPRRHELPQPVLHLARQPSALAHQLAQERRAAAAERGEHRLGGMGEDAVRPRARGVVVRGRRQPLQVLAQEERDRGGAGRPHPPPRRRPRGSGGGLRAVERGMRRQAPPRHLPGETEPIQHLRLVAFHAGGQHVAFPGRGGDLAALELPDHLQQPARTVQARPRRETLPAGQEPHQVRGRHRRDLPAQAAQRQPVDAGQHAAIAPLDPARFVAGRGGEAPAQHLSFPLQTGQSGGHARGRHGQRRGQLRRAQRPAGIEPAPQHLGQRRLGTVRRRLIDRRHGRVDPARRVREQRGPGALGGHPEDRVADAQGRRAAVRGQPLEPRPPFLARRRQHQRQQRVVQLLRVAHQRPRLGRDLRDRGGVERADLAAVLPQRAP